MATMALLDLAPCYLSNVTSFHPLHLQYSSSRLSPCSSDYPSTFLTLGLFICCFFFQESSIMRYSFDLFLTYFRSLLTNHLRSKALPDHIVYYKITTLSLLLALFDLSPLCLSSTIGDYQIFSLDFSPRLPDKHFYLIIPQTP